MCEYKIDSKLNNFYLNLQSNWVNILPEKRDSVLDNAIAVNREYLVAVYMRNVTNVIQIHNLKDGKYLFDVETPIGTVNSISGSRNSTEFFYKITSFLHPGIVYRYDFNASLAINKIKVLHTNISIHYIHCLF